MLTGKVYVNISRLEGVRVKRWMGGKKRNTLYVWDR